MIRYALRCARGHEFDSWFQSAAAFDRLEAAGRLACATCGGHEVGKALMAPSVQTDPAARPEPATGPAVADRPLAAPGDEVERLLAAMRRHVEATSDYVGLDFVAEVRGMHDGVAPVRPVWGEARLDEARALIDDGIPVAPLPFRPTRTTN